MKVLHDYQRKVVRDVLKTSADMLVEQPTGSGKTLEIVAIAAELLSRQSRVLIAAPQEHIEASFVRRDYAVLQCGNKQYVVPPEMLRAAREANCISAEIRAYLGSKDPGYALVCTHNALNKLKPPTNLSKDLRDCILVVDEAHHASAVGLSQFVNSWVRAGGRVLFFTATAYRADEQPVALAGMKIIRRSLPLHMMEGFAPAKLESGLHAIRLQEKVTMKQFHGETAVHSTGPIVAEMIRTWKSDGRPKTIVRVPSIRGGSDALVSSLLAGFTAAGARVLNAAGDNRAVRNELLTVLTQERALTAYEESQYDVIVGVQRVSEGMDWRWASSVYCVGLPRAISTVVQLMGRAMRAKPATYPKEYRNLVKIRFFVPCDTKKALHMLPSYHSRTALLVCAFLAHSESGSIWSVVKEMGHGLSASLGTAIKTEESLENDEEIYPYIDPKLRAEAVLSIAAATEALEEIETPVTPESVLNYLSLARQDLSPAVIRQILIEGMVAEQEISVTEAVSRLHNGVRRHLKPGTSLRLAIETAFAEVLADFNHSTLKTSEVRRHLSRHLHALNAPKMLDFANQLFALRPLDRVWLAKVSYEHRSIHGEFPEAKTKGGPNWPQESWKEIDAAITARERGWPATAEHNLKEFCCGLSVLDTVGGALQQFRLTAGLPAVYQPLVDQLLGTQVRFFHVRDYNGGRPSRAIPVGELIPLASLPLRQYRTDFEVDGKLSSIGWPNVLSSWWHSLYHSRYRDLFSWTLLAMGLDLMDRFVEWLESTAQVTWKSGKPLVAPIGSHYIQGRVKGDLSSMLDRAILLRQPEPAELRLHTSNTYLSDLRDTKQCYLGGVVRTPWHVCSRACVGNLQYEDGQNYVTFDAERAPSNTLSLALPVRLLAKKDWLSWKIADLPAQFTLPKDGPDVVEHGLYVPITWVYGSLCRDAREVCYTGADGKEVTLRLIRWDQLDSLATTHPLTVWVGAESEHHIVHEVQGVRFRPYQCWWDPKEGETPYRWPKTPKEKSNV